MFCSPQYSLIKSINIKLVMGCGQKRLRLVWRRQRHLPRVSRQSANDKGDNEIYRVMCTDNLAFVLRLRKTPEQGGRLMKVVRPFIASNGVPYIQMRSVGSHSTSGREKNGRTEGRKERTKGLQSFLFISQFRLLVGSDTVQINYWYMLMSRFTL